MCIQVNVNLPLGGEKIIDLCDNVDQLKKLTVLDLKKKITKELATADDLRIVYKAQILEEQATLESSQIRHLSSVQTLLRLPGGV